MKRSVPLTVDRLEDRCVPAVGPVAATLPVVAPDPSAVVQTSAESQPIDVTKTAIIAPQSLVIDGYFIDPNNLAPPPKPLVVDPVAPIPDAYWQASQAPQGLLPPVNNPFWY